MPHQLWLTEFLNHQFGALVTALLRQFGIEPKYPSAPITNFVAMELLVFAILIVFFLIVRARLSVDKPGGMQHVLEILQEYVSDQADQVIGHDYKRFVPYVIALGYFILFANLIGMVPGFESPTANPSVPLGCALCTWVYYHYHGIRQHKAHYIKQFLGPVWWMIPLMFVIEIISHLARILSLTVRLFANIYAGDMITLAFFSLTPLLVPVVFLGLHLGVSLVQTFIFIMLTMVYLGMAVGEEH
ncbi:MAG: F0F1 ATP synthase subunit A [Acidobacteriales bacterium]|nr:F0F1 ATP synthase subunit A [Terriglobales bacterium]